jgi:ATP-dependent Lhr-like helicase
VLVHQLLALTLQHGGLSPQECWQILSVIPDFAGISRAEFDGLIAHLVRTEYLYFGDGRISMGSQAERTFGRRNFMEIYAVFESPALYRVQTASQGPIGALEQTFVDRLVEEESAFLLGGRAWSVESIDHGERTIVARPAPSGRQPSWGGWVPQLLGFALCREIAALLAAEAPIPCADAPATGQIAIWRTARGPLLRCREPWLAVEAGRVVWWTFAGGRINHTLKYGLLVLTDWQVVCDNFALRVEGESASLGALSEAVRTLRAPGFWEQETVWERILEKLPNYRLSKFQRALPTACAQEMVANSLLDVPGTRAYLASNVFVTP